MTADLPTPTQAKRQAKQLRDALAEQGTVIGHAKSLELVAHKYGLRDWNVMVAAMGNAAPDIWAVGDRVTGTYLSQPFSATIIAVVMQRTGWFRLELQFDTPVDVVTSAHFSNLRKRVRGVVGPKGHSAERTSDGVPQLVIDLT
jgi:hypothetical protein